MTTKPPGSRARSTPYKLTDEVLARICERIAAGDTREGACASEGVTDSALRKLRKAREDVDELVSEAEGKGAQWYANKVQECEAGKDAGDDWKRWAWLGERLHPSVLGPPKIRTEVSGPDGAAQEHNVSVTIEDAKRIARSKDSK